MKLGESTYLGDGLYAVWDGYQVELYAWDGIGKTNRVFLDPQVLAAFERWVAEMKAAVAAEEVPSDKGGAA